MTLPYVDFSAIRRDLSIHTVLERYSDRISGRISVRGNRVRCACPLHKGTNPSAFTADLSRTDFYCHSCKAKGSVIDLLARLEGISVHAAAIQASEMLGQLPVAEKRRPQPVSSEPHHLEPNKPLDFRLTVDPTHPYLAERGLTPETVATFGLGFCSEGIQKGRIAIPIHNSAGECVAYAGRWPGDPPDETTPKYRLPPRRYFRPAVELFNFHRAIAAEGALILVEGFLDVMALWQAGYRTAVSPMSANLSSVQAQLVLRSEWPTVLVFFDPDEAGDTGAGVVFDRLGPHKYLRKIVARADPGDLSPTEIHELLDGLAVRST